MADVTISEPWFPRQVDLRVGASEGLELPSVPNTWATGSGGWEWLWLGPDEWLAVGPHGMAMERIGELEGALDGRDLSIVDVSAGRAVLDLIGDARHELLSHGCGLDLHPRWWSEGMCAQTLLARVPVILQERADMTRVFVRPSFAEWLLSWLGARLTELG